MLCPETDDIAGKNTTEVKTHKIKPTEQKKHKYRK